MSKKRLLALMPQTKIIQKIQSLWQIYNLLKNKQTVNLTKIKPAII